jgi:hypothetical protein
MRELEPPYRAIWNLLQRGRVIPVLGAGASLGERGERVWDPKRPDCLPTAAELGRYLAGEASFPSDESTRDLAKVAQYYSVVLGRPVLRQELHGIFAGQFAHGSIHRLLAEVPAPLLVITTNYDDLIEQAFRERGREFDLVIYPTDNVEEWGASVAHWAHGATAPDYVSPKRLRIDLAQRTVVFKMHGTIDRADAEREAYVITEDDYSDFLVRMAKQTAIPAIFAEHFRMRHFLFLGYSLNDWNFRVILSRIERDLPRSSQQELPAWSIQFRPSPLEQALWARRQVNIYDMPITDFAARLRQATPA